MDKSGWEAQEAFDRYIGDVKASLGPNASFMDIEEAILKYSPEIMRNILEGLANSEDFSPRGESDT